MKLDDILGYLLIISSIVFASLLIYAIYFDDLGLILAILFATFLTYMMFLIYTVID